MDQWTLLRWKSNHWGSQLLLLLNSTDVEGENMSFYTVDDSSTVHGFGFNLKLLFSQKWTNGLLNKNKFTRAWWLESLSECSTLLFMEHTDTQTWHRYTPTYTHTHTHTEILMLSINNFYIICGIIEKDEKSSIMILSAEIINILQWRPILKWLINSQHDNY